MRKGKLVFLTILVFSLALFLSGCGPTNQPPTATFTTNTNNSEVTFDASGSSDPDGNIVSYSWDFGDGSTGSDVSVTHNYNSAGSYNVELTVTDSTGAQDTSSKTVSVTAPSNPPTASFTANPTSGEAPLEVSFDASGSSDSNGNITSYSWNFGDSSSGSGKTTNHTFNSSGSYTVKLTVTDNDGVTDTTTQPINVSSPPSNPPTASFTASPTSGEAPLEVSFDASGSSDPDGTIDTYSWDFGDGSTGNGETTSNIYSSSGNYTVQLTVEDNGGVTDSMTMNVSVSAPSNESPDASFSANPTSGTSPLDVSFDASNSNDPDGSIASYEWDFDDGSSGTGITIDHTFENPDDPIDSRFNVELTVTDNDGASNTATETITVSPPENQPPNASFTATPNSGEAALKVEFDASGSSDSDGAINQYSWSFGAFGETVTHTFNTAGDYKVTLEVRDDDLATDSTTKTISVSAPNYNFLAIGEPYEAPDGLTVTLNSLDVTEKSGSYEYSINYTLENNTEDQKIDEGTFKMYYENKTGGEPQYGFFDELFPGDSITRTYTFEELKSDPYGILEYHHDHFFADNPLPDSLKWKVTLP